MMRPSPRIGFDRFHDPVVLDLMPNSKGENNALFRTFFCPEWRKPDPCELSFGAKGDLCLRYLYRHLPQ
jgi:hypothetical protein